MTQRNLLTEKTVLNIQPDNEPFYLFDGDGLMLKVNPDGSKEWWAECIHRWDTGETFRDQDIIGHYPELNLDEARATKEYYLNYYNDCIDFNEDEEEYHSVTLEIITIDLLGEEIGDPIISSLLEKIQWQWFGNITVKELFNQLDNISKEDFLSVGGIPKNSLIIEQIKKYFLEERRIKADELDQCKLIPINQ